MRRHPPTSAAALLLLALALLVGPPTGSARAGEPPAGVDYGAGIRGGASVGVDELVADPQRFTGAPVLVRGRISDVCEKKGCWTVLRGEREQVRVLHGDHDFALPADCRGQQAFAQGRLEIRSAAADEIAHYAAESRSGEVPEARDPERSLRLVATGVRLVPRAAED